MLFSSPAFFLFFTVVLVLLRVMHGAWPKKLLLLAASCFFYAFWDWRFLFLMLAAITANYYFGQRIERAEPGAPKRVWLVGSIVFNLGILAFFKYFNFFLGSLNLVLQGQGVRLPFLDILLPVGISFIVFEVLSYNIDIYRGENKSSQSWTDLALLVSFFPHLIAGPILKPKEFLPQLQREILIRKENIYEGIPLFLFGLAKKLLIADQLARFVDPVFAAPLNYSSTTVWLAVIAYSIQIYCDFSGYTDMARASAKCIGFEIPKNFNMPYSSLSITEFWRRWHISLSSWLRDYLYIPLGGNRKGEVRQYINLFITMLLGGLWHGASWNFVFWGALHGVGLAVHKKYMELGIKPRGANKTLYDAASWALTMVFVMVAWVFFRSKDFATSWTILAKMFVPSADALITWHPLSLALIVTAVVACHLLGRHGLHLPTFDPRSGRSWFIVAAAAILMLVLMPTQSTPFIYFQF